MITSVGDNKRLYTARDIELADRARTLSKNMGYPSPAALINMINKGSIVNCPVTAKDVQRATEIYGPEVAALRGRTTTDRAIPYTSETIPRTVPVEQTLHADIFFVDKRAFLLSRSEPLAYLMESARTRALRPASGRF
jgi:hypothetical protein